MILVGAMCLGFVQIVTGMAISFIKSCGPGPGHGRHLGGDHLVGGLRRTRWQFWV